MLQLARQQLGLSCYLGGTGMVIDITTLRKFGWNATSLTEDLEFSVKALVEGIKTDWVHEAIVYDEKPLTFAQAWKQRKRWAQGHIDLLNHYFVPILTKAIKKRSILLFDCCLVLFQPILVILAGFLFWSLLFMLIILFIHQFYIN